MVKGVVFDLDGTLADTLTDLCEAVNYSMHKNCFEKRSFYEIRSFVGNGIRKLIERSIPSYSRSDENIDHCEKVFIEYYNIHCSDNTCPYDGIYSLLLKLVSENIKLAVVSNKSEAETKKIVNTLFGNIHFSAVYGHSEGSKHKPDPTLTLKAVSEMSIFPEECLYVGDSPVDIKTAQNAGIRICSVTWGFSSKEVLSVLNPDFIAENAEHLERIILIEGQKA